MFRFTVYLFTLSPLDRTMQWQKERIYFKG
jgi:hypothetical protein